MIIFIASSAVAANGTWLQKASLPTTTTTRGECGAFSINGKGYIFGGTLAYPTWLNETWEYDPATDSWTQKASIPATGLREPAFFVIGNKGYAGTGMTGSSQVKAFYEFDPVANTWTAKANLAGSARRDAIGFAVGGKGYIGTGNSTGGELKDLWEYDPATDKWISKTSLTGVVRDASIAFAIGTKGYVTTGRNGASTYTDCWEYDPNSNAWTQKANFPGVSRSEAVSFVIGTKGYVGSGHTGGVADFWSYNQNTNTWDSVTTLTGGERAEAVGFAIGNKGYVFAGYITGSGAQRDLWEYTPSSTVSLNEMYARDFFQIYPNPTNDFLYISSSEPDLIEIKITSLSGDLVYENKTQLKAKEPFLINASNFASGMYQIQLSGSRTSKAQSILIK